MLTGCTSWFGGSSWFSTKKSVVSTTSAATADTTSSTASWFSKKKPSPDLCVATARLCESRGDFAGAAAQYEVALKESPDYIPALLSYAHLQDHQNKLPEATKLYDRAVKANPKEASAYNDMGLCLARQGKAADALGAMGKAIQLQPDKALYRNNMAVVLVDQHRVDDALAQLRAVATEAVANYDIGILLEQRKQDVLAQRALPTCFGIGSSVHGSPFVERTLGKACRGVGCHTTRQAANNCCSGSACRQCTDNDAATRHLRRSAECTLRGLSDRSSIRSADARYDASRRQRAKFDAAAGI